MRSITIAVLLAGPAEATSITGVAAGDQVTITCQSNGPRLDANDRVSPVGEA